ncbi:ABC transporter ATP-binding protein [Rhodoligotrophos ferricapiens]|uniref:ABC transporter ATP-binding protein n=1 Tax=Rhodoligotrophos ferricapiens TaxID=3069264 RepID=UPI00315C659D
MSALATRNAVVSFGGLNAVNNVSLVFEQGQITGLIGPNGSGKSTLVNLISGQIPPTAGEVFLGDTKISVLRPDQIVAQGLARTYQIPKVPPELTVEEVISVPLIYVGRRDRLINGLTDERSIADFCGLMPVFRRPCAQLSVPDLRRLEIARALACGPSVLLLDEVMAGLSHEDAYQVVRIIRQIHAAGLTIVIIEHVMRIIADLCGGVVVLNNGSVLARGTPEQALSDPAVREAYLGKGFAL